MASSCTWVVKTVWGNKRVQLGTMTATDGTDEVLTGLHYIDFACATPNVVTGTEPSCNLTINAAANGGVALTTGVSGGVYSVLVIGN